jgi:hypothetical protein
MTENKGGRKKGGKGRNGRMEEGNGREKKKKTEGMDVKKENMGHI